METREFESPVGQRLADLAGIEHDLKLAGEACNLFLNMPSVGSRDAIAISNAIASYALVTYFRAMGSGIRGSVTAQQIRVLPPVLQESHSYLKSIRDHYVAHSVNRQEQNKVMVELSLDGSIASLGTEHSRPATFSDQDVLALKHLIDEIVPIVIAEYDSEWKRVWDSLHQLDPGALEQVLKAEKQAKPLESRLKQSRFRS